MIEYKDKLTLDGRIKAPLGVTKAKVQAVKTLTEATMRGDRIAKGRLEESLTTSDAIFNYAQLVNINVLAQYDEEPRVWNQVAGTRSVSDFRAPTLYSLVPEWQPGVLGSGTPRNVAPAIPEGSAYPYATLTGEESAVGGVQKRGFKVGFSFEAFINDAIGFLQAIPESMRQVALDTEEYEVFSALVTGVGDAQQLQGGDTPTSATAVPANAPFSREALTRALIELSEREVNGRRVRLTGGFNLVVPTGQGVFVNFVLNQTFAEVQDGAYVLNINGYNPLAGIRVIESEYVTGTQWFLVPQVGTTGGRPVLELLRLAGHELPELRVEGATGTYVGGATVSPFEGSFDNDTTDFRLRSVGKGVLWTPDLVVWSDGSGTA